MEQGESIAQEIDITSRESEKLPAGALVIGSSL
jgi:hypothetical protein